MVPVAVRRHLGGGLALLSPPGVLRWCGVALAVGGALVALSMLSESLFVVGVLDRSPPCYEVCTGEDRREQVLITVQMLLRALLLPLGALLVPVGLTGLWFLLKERPARIPRTLTKVGAPFSVLAVAALIYLDRYQRSSFEPVPVPVLQGAYAAGLVGLLLPSVAALWVRGLGRFRFLPLALWLLVTPPPYVLILSYLNRLIAASEFGTLPPALGMLPAAPVVLAGLGWMLLARPLVRAPERERALVARDRARVAADNLARARRLYAEAWVGGNLAAIDELAAPDLVDRYGSGHGPQSLKRSVAGLRKSFPDLRFAVEEGEANGDEVTTRWTASGTDRGGVLWYPPTGKQATFGGTFVDHFVDGKLVEHRGTCDTASLLEQLGLPGRSE